MLPIVAEAPQAIAGIEQIPKEIYDLSQEEVEEIVSLVADELDFGHDAATQFAERAIRMIAGLAMMIATIKKAA